MRDGPKFLLVVLYWAIRAYVVLLFIWAVMTWIPGLAGSQLHNFIGLPVVPVLRVFSFLSFAGIGFGAVVVAFGLNFIANLLARQIMHGQVQDGPPAIEASEAQPGDRGEDSPAG